MRKILTFLFAALMSASMFALTPLSGDTWDEGTKTLTVNSNPGFQAYANKAEIEHVIISSGVESIGGYAFYGCSGLTSITIPNSVTSIGDRAFMNCSNLTSITIPSSVTNMGGADTFYGCTNITDVYCYPNAADLTWGEDGDDFKNGGSTVCHVYAGQLSAYQSKFTDVNVTFVGDLPAPAPATYDVTANLADGAYWATFYSNAGNYQAPEGTQVFAVTLTGTAIEMTVIPNRIALSGKGVVLKNTTTGSFTMTKTETTPDVDYSGSSLTGTMTSITNPGDAYVLNGTNGAGFYKLSDGGTIGANKAYLTYSGAGAREFFLFDEATGIEQMEAEAGDGDGKVYDLQGREVENPAPGIYIVNGKKVFIK